MHQRTFLKIYIFLLHVFLKHDCMSCPAMRMTNLTSHSDGDKSSLSSHFTMMVFCSREHAAIVSRVHFSGICDLERVVIVFCRSPVNTNSILAEVNKDLFPSILQSKSAAPHFKIFPYTKTRRRSINTCREGIYNA